MMDKNKKITFLYLGIILAFAALTVLLSFQNYSLKTTLASKTESKQENLFEQNLEAQFLFKKFPFNINLDDFYFHDNTFPDAVNGYVIIVFDLTVCGKCLHEELIALNNFKESLRSKNICLLALVGISDKSEEGEIINLHRTGKIFFPAKTIGVDLLYDLFKLEKDQFIDTPFYFYTSHSFRTLDIFKPNYMATKEFIKWLTIISEQDIL